MSISSVTSTNTYQPAYASSLSQARQAFQDLGQALSSGDLTGAQQAFATFQQNLPANVQSASTQNSDAGAQGIQNLGSALQSGNLSDAQKAYDTIKQKMGGAGKAKGHHHHRGAGKPGTTTSAAPAANQAQPATYTASGNTGSAGQGDVQTVSQDSLEVSIRIDLTA